MFGRILMPLTLSNDREAGEVAVGGVGLVPREALKILHIRNTLQIGEVEVSEAYGDGIQARDDLEVIREAQSMSFDGEGNLIPNF